MIEDDGLDWMLVPAKAFGPCFRTLSDDPLRFAFDGVFIRIKGGTEMRPPWVRAVPGMSVFRLPKTFRGCFDAPTQAKTQPFTVYPDGWVVADMRYTEQARQEMLRKWRAECGAD